MKRINLLIIFFLFSSLAFAQKKQCYTIDEVVNKTLSSLEKNDVNSYLEMWSKDAFLEILNADTTIRQRDIIIKNIDKLDKSHKDSFEALEKQMKGKFFTDVFQITLIKYTDVPAKEDKSLKPHEIDILFVLNGVSERILCDIYEYKGCYYFFEPIPRNL